MSPTWAAGALFEEIHTRNDSFDLTDAEECFSSVLRKYVRRWAAAIEGLFGPDLALDDVPTDVDGENRLTEVVQSAPDCGNTNVLPIATLNAADFDQTQLEVLLGNVAEMAPLTYFPARLAGIYPTATDALCYVGFGVEEADILIKQAGNRQNRSVAANLDGIGVFTVPIGDGRIGLWYACLGQHFGTSEEAKRFANELEAEFEDDKGGTWLIIALIQPVVRTLH